MDEISLILGITGTGGFAISIILYALSKGMNSKCRSMQMEMSLDIHSVDSDPMKQQIGSITRGELEEIIIGTLAKHTPALTNTNVIVPQYPSQNKDFEDMLKSTILQMNDRGSPFTRSRSESEDSHKSHKSHKSNKSLRTSYSKNKEDSIIILQDKEEL